MGGGSQQLLCLNPTTALVVLLLGLWLLLGCDNSKVESYARNRWNEAQNCSLTLQSLDLIFVGAL